MKRQYPPPPRKKHPYNPLEGGPHSSNQWKGAINCCRKTSTPGDVNAT